MSDKLCFSNEGLPGKRELGSCCSRIKAAAQDLPVDTIFILRSSNICFTGRGGTVSQNEDRRLGRISEKFQEAEEHYCVWEGALCLSPSHLIYQGRC